MIAILDTGPWVALIDRSESRHTECVQWLKNFSGTLYSTEAVLIVPSSAGSLKKTKKLMKKYADLPMDFADATIVCLAAETGMQNVVTFDRKDFAVYKLPGKKSFTIMP